MTVGYGIDFGTTNSVASGYDSSIRKSIPFPDATSKLPHPSVVWFREGGAVVGADARRNLNGFANVAGNQFVTSIKRNLGRDQSLSIFSDKMPVWKIAAQIFRHLIERARNEHGHDLREAVVTVPVYFGGAARRELRRAANDAGIYIKRFIHEPFAAVVGFCHKEGTGLDAKSLEDKNILVFDWGGGTLDITVARVSESCISELSNAGLEDCAGDLFDRDLGKLAVHRFADHLQVSEAHVDLLPGNLDRLRSESERVKIALSGRDEEPLQVANFWRRDGREYSIDQIVARADFEVLVAPHVEAAMSQVGRALEAANLLDNDVDIVLLIGGSSRIRLVREQLGERFGHRLHDVANADTVISEGAAIVDGLGLQPVLTHAICVEMADGTPYTVFPAGHVATPTTVQQRLEFHCTDNRDGEARLILSQQSSHRGGRTAASREILQIPVSRRLPKPYNHERVTTEFALDEDMVLHVSGKGATQEQGSRREVFDLCFGLLMEGPRS